MCFASWLLAGTCKWFDVTKGYGFIKPDDGSQDLFVHQVTAQRVLHDAVLSAWPCLLLSPACAA